MAELLWRSEVATVIADVGADAAALAPPLITVGGETRKSKIKTLEASHEHFFSCAAVSREQVVARLPGLDVLGHYAPR